MKRNTLPNDVLRALADADRAPGWNTRRRDVRRFELDGCTLYVVPYRRFAYRRIERAAAAWHAEQAQA